MNRPNSAESGAELVEFIRLESSGPKDGESSSILHQYAIEQLVESALGAEIDAAANSDIASSVDSFEYAVCSLAESTSFRFLQEAVQQCNTSLSEEDTSGTSNDSNKKPKTPDATKAKPTSFSLFDMLDQQKGGFVLPPRITAYKVIEAHQREKDGVFDGNTDCKSSLELLEKADDIEDLNPDPESWEEEVRQILYNGLVDLNKSTDTQARYLKMHKTLIDICQPGNGASNNKAQCWDLVQNLVGFILTQSCDFMRKSHEVEPDSAIKQRMDLYWDTIQLLLASMEHLALDYITSCVGDERQIERMVLGLCLILADDTAASTLSALDPLAGWFEVWARFVPPRRMMTIIKCSGLGGTVLQRCQQLGASDPTKKLAGALQRCKKSTTLRNVEHAQHLQSLSILRTALYQCGPSDGAAAAAIAQQSYEKSLLSACLTSAGVACTERVQELLDQAEVEFDKHDPQMLRKALELVFQPFQNALSSKELYEDPHVQWLCTSSLELYHKLKKN